MCQEELKLYVCKECKKELPASAFYKNPSHKNGLRTSKCKGCVSEVYYMDSDRIKAKQAEYYIDNKESIIKRNSKRASEIYWTNEVAREKEKCRALTRYYISIGVLVRPDECPCCKEEAHTIPHHKTYVDPLDVYWVCKDCHKEVHMKYPPWRRSAFNYKE